MSMVGFTGPRTGATEAQIKTLGTLLIQLNATTFFHGDCIGSDAQAHDVAEALELEIHIHPPTDNKFRAFKKSQFIAAPKHYYARNRDIVNAVKIIISTPWNPEYEPWDAGGGGTWFTLRCAREQKREIYLIMPNGAIRVRS